MNLSWRAWLLGLLSLIKQHSGPWPSVRTTSLGGTLTLLSSPHSMKATWCDGYVPTHVNAARDDRP